MADGDNDKTSSGQASSLGAGKDLLFGWLVGRAAADLGLAQALAASEAQRVEQIKRLEDSLLAQIHELQNPASIAAVGDIQFAELHELKAEFGSVAERLGRLETIAQQAVQSRDQLAADAAMVQSEMVRQRNLFEDQGGRFHEIAEGISARLRDLEEQIRHQSRSPDQSDANFAELRAEMRAVTDRFGQAELSIQQLQKQTTDEAERLREQTASLVKSENAALKAEFFEQLENLQASQSTVKHLAESFDKRLEGVRRELGETVAAHVNAEVHGLHTQLASVRERIEAAPPIAISPVDLDAERARWSKDVDDSIRSRMDQLGDEIREELRSTAGSKVDRENFQVELGALTDRVAKIESAAQQRAASLGNELSAVRAGLSGQQEQQQATDALLKSLEDTVRAKFQEIQNYLVQQQGNFQHREAQSEGLNTEMQRLVQRIAEVESTAHRAHALMVNENQQTVQLTEGFRTEIDDLRGRLNDRPSLAGVVETVENLSAKTREIQNQFAERMLAIDRRESEFREIKAQIQTITRKMLQLESPSPTLPNAVANRTRESVVAPAEISELRLAPEDRPSAEAAMPKSAALGTRTTADEDTVVSKERLLEGGKDQITQLHERISADIERARAELREKSGRWKVRR